jgi:hypothetical protein
MIVVNAQVRVPADHALASERAIVNLMARSVECLTPAHPATRRGSR